ncbi:hypothetical protein [Prauserella endophytica]|uniref:DUF222 domain-containing protein n=1 Tax=Prauserella endophytica TaxID=1592324 RepID=A0ABY2RV18_9PSEU|nr:hypothetical protein [Prauserella endophytica]TKG61567.1 hypothetical protein FCN18_33555 [Prauserella endophytica]
MTTTWTAESILAAASDDTRDRITAHGPRIRIDDRPATDSELRLLADLAHSGLIDLNTQVPVGRRCCWVTAPGRKQARRWARLQPIKERTR